MDGASLGRPSSYVFVTAATIQALCIGVFLIGRRR
jgi:hypothetical protein